MKTGVLTTLNNEVEENIRKVAELGIYTCQLKCWDSRMLTDEMADRAKAASEQYGVEITAFWVGWDGVAVWDFVDGPLTLGLVPAVYRNERMNMLLKGAECAKSMGVTDVVTHVGFLPINPSSSEWMELVSCLRHICRVLLKNGQYFLFETGQETPVTLLRMIEDIGTGNVGINLDPANLLLYGMANPVDALDVFGKYVRGIHAKDGDYPTDGRHLGKQYPIGEGRVDFPKFIGKLREVGYDGALTIEREISGPKQIEDIMAAKKILDGLI